MIKFRWMMMTMMLACALAMTAIACGGDDDDDDDATDVGTGTLNFYANGEEFGRNGFTTKDGWALSFDGFWANVTGFTAYQAAITEKHPGHPHSDIPEGASHVALVDSYWVNLAEGDDRTLVASMEDVPAGNYNYVNFVLDNTDEGDFAGNTIVWTGTATKDEDTVDFTIALPEQMIFINCLQEVDDAEAGVVEDGGEGSVELTLHADHLFGDADEPEDTVDGVNEFALGFEPFAEYALANGNSIDTTGHDLSEFISDTEKQVFVTALYTIGHSGEGHCDYETYSEDALE
ncbi:hypothetical protein KDL45_13595 [bacterium]|nr:hypothetical protein [bacterium]